MTFPPARPEDVRATSVTMIGRLAVRRGGTVLRAHQLGGPKPRQILEILLLNIGRPVSKDRLIDLLWGDTRPNEAVTSIESYVSVLRRHLQPGSGRHGPLGTTTGGYQIEASSVDLDLARFDALVLRAQHANPSAAYPLLIDALSLTTGPLLADELRPAWAQDERRRHAAVVTAARVQASVTAAAIGRLPAAIHWANQALLDDPVNEAAWTALILALENSGQLAEGLRGFARYRSILDRELGCAPSKTLCEAHLRLLLATANSQGELSDAMSALLVLHDQLVSTATGGARTHSMADSSARAAVLAAEHVLTSFIRRVGVSATSP